jgi:hypothetical protein
MRPSIEDYADTHQGNDQEDNQSNLNALAPVAVHAANVA